MEPQPASVDLAETKALYEQARQKVVDKLKAEEDAIAAERQRQMNELAEAWRDFERLRNRQDADAEAFTRARDAHRAACTEPLLQDCFAEMIAVAQAAQNAEDTVKATRLVPPHPLT